jgi:thiol-disulfide isomerase/thioredoxin
VPCLRHTKPAGQVLGVEEWIRRALDVAVLVGVVAVAFGLDREILTRLSLSSTANLEQRLVDRFHPQTPPTVSDEPMMAPHAMMAGGNKPAMSDSNAMTAGNKPAMSGNNVMMAAGGSSAANTSPVVDLSDATAWINSQPLTLASLHGKVVLINFWTYSCINCLRTLPYLKAWNEKYKDSGLSLSASIRQSFRSRKTSRTSARPYAISASPIPSRWITTIACGAASTTNTGRRTTSSTQPDGFVTTISAKVAMTIRELDPQSPRRGQSQAASGSATQIAATGAEAAADSGDVRSPEAYIGYHRAENFASPGGFNQNEPQVYEAPANLSRRTPVSVDPTAWSHPRPYLPYRVSGSWHSGLRLHLRLRNPSNYRERTYRGKALWQKIHQSNHSLQT